MSSTPKREYDAGDFRRMVRANHDRIRPDQLRQLADEVRDGAGAESNGSW